MEVVPTKFKSWIEKHADPVAETPDPSSGQPASETGASESVGVGN